MFTRCNARNRACAQFLRANALKCSTPPYSLGNLKLMLQVDIRIRLSYRKHFINGKNDIKNTSNLLLKSNTVGITKIFLA